METGIVFNIQKFYIHDGDGIRTFSFSKGCPLRCVWCHNPESFEKATMLSFNHQKCSLCGKCFAVCSARTIENGILKMVYTNIQLQLFPQKMYSRQKKTPKIIAT